MSDPAFPDSGAAVSPATQASPPDLEAAEAARAAAIGQLLAKIRNEQNLALGIVGGVAGGALGAVLWTMITASTHFQIGYMAVGVGFLAGYGVRTFGRGLDRSFGIAGALIALLGCAAGNIGAAAVAVAAELHRPLADVLARLTPHSAWLLLTADPSPIDLLFYGLAVYFGYKYAFRRLTPAEIASIPQ